MIIAVLACDEDWGIGHNGMMPWPHHSKDLKWFKEQTLNKTIIMGKATWDSLPKKPLPNRHNIVVTSTQIDDVTCLSIDGAIEYLSENSDSKVCVIGGAKLFTALLPYIDEIHLSRIKGVYNCDTMLPKDKILDQYSLQSGYRDRHITTEVWRKQ